MVVLGPSSNGHRIVRMSLANGELIDMRGMPTFDQALVGPDLCLIASPGQVTAIDSRTLDDAVDLRAQGRALPRPGPPGRRVFVVFIARQDAQAGRAEARRRGRRVRRRARGSRAGVDARRRRGPAGGGAAVSDLAAALPKELLVEYLTQNPDEGGGGRTGLALLALDPGAEEGDAPLWFESIEGGERDEIPEV